MKLIVSTDDDRLETVYFENNVQNIIISSQDEPLQLYI